MKIKKYVKTNLLFLLALIVIAFSFIMPKMLLQVEDLSREQEIFTRQEKKSKINVQAEKIYLVRFIHDVYELRNTKVAYYDDKKSVAVSMPITEKGRNTSLPEAFKNEISKLVTSGIINDIDFDEFVNYDETTKTFSEYVVITSNIYSDNKRYWNRN